MNEMNELKVFSIEEANRMIPVLSLLISELHRKRDSIVGVEVGVDALELVCDETKEAVPEGLEDLMSEHREAVREFDAVVDEIHSHGCYLKDIDLGLIDLYGIVDGRVVYLCWRLGEDRGRFWHEVGQGYAHRQSLHES